MYPFIFNREILRLYLKVFTIYVVPSLVEYWRIFFFHTSSARSQQSYSEYKNFVSKFQLYDKARIRMSVLLQKK